MHFPLHPDTPTEVKALADLFRGRDLDVDRMKADMRERMAAEGLEYGDRTHTYNSRLAQELGKWAKTQPRGEAIHDALFRAYFVDALNVGDAQTLLEIAEATGLPRAEAETVLRDRTFSDAIDADWQLSRNYGVTGVPTFVAGGYGVVGAQPYDGLNALVTKAQTEPGAADV